MAIRKTRTDPATGKTQAGTLLEIVEAVEPVTRLTLEDGTIIRVRLTVTEVMRLDEPDPQGKPTYGMDNQIAITIIPPEDQT